ncbi:hypothetical protein RFM98_17700 [Mesorhizobium sp. VK9D]|nr:hypothetical protein [Mesorhizobium sp. VK9D]MDX8454598.1 hypothetical protein [Mesorhizobium sp. VK9D]
MNIATTSLARPPAPPSSDVAPSWQSRHVGQPPGRYARTAAL